MAATKKSLLEKARQQIKIQLPRLWRDFGPQNLHRGPSARCFVKVPIQTFSKHPRTLESGKYSWSYSLLKLELRSQKWPLACFGTLLRRHSPEAASRKTQQNTQKTCKMKQGVCANTKQSGARSATAANLACTIRTNFCFSINCDSVDNQNGLLAQHGGTGLFRRFKVS